MINNSRTLYEITNEYPETIPVFVANGFPGMKEDTQRKSFGATITLGNALAMKGLDSDTFLGLLQTAIDGKEALREEGIRSEEGASLNITGLLPCPVRLPLLEQFEPFIEEYEGQSGLKINYELKAASMGLQWVEEHLKDLSSPDDLPDLFLSAGFDMFFDKKQIGQFRDAGVFADLIPERPDNPLFTGTELADPDRVYSMIALVPAVFLVNEDELGDLPMPRKWSDLFAPEFEKRVSLPVGDFDLFNGILINIHRQYGDEGVEKLGRSLLESMHPSQMVKSGTRKEARPIITIMPNFFTKMVREGMGMKAVWPEDGAIVSPVFMLAKKERTDALKPVVDFFASKEVGEVLAHQGLFPSLHPEVDNRLPAGSPIMWPGWKYLREHDISELIAHCETVFHRAVAA